MLKSILPRNVTAALWRFYRRTEQAELDLIAAGVAFYGFLAIFPAAAAIIAIWGFASDPSVIRAQVGLLHEFVPPDVFSLINDQVESLLRVNSRQLGWATVVSTAIALWSARAGVGALIRGLNAIHGLPNRAGAWHYVGAMTLTLAMIGLVLAAMLASVVVPLVIGAMPLLEETTRFLNLLNLCVGFALVVVAVAVTYRFGPNFPWRRPPLFTLGLLVAVILWLLAARLFMLYLANFDSYNRIYGSIGAVAALMMWLYVSAYAILLGAAVDAERSRRTSRAPVPLATDQ
ncbi:MAG: YihY/virulence factor BrkB family protein [Paracoccaceae bacterium]